MENIRAILEEAGLGFENVVKTTVYLDDIRDFGPMNEIAPYPARAALAAASLPKGEKVEIEVIAAK